jgi:hypothetical protein
VTITIGFDVKQTIIVFGPTKTGIDVFVVLSLSSNITFLCIQIKLIFKDLKTYEPATFAVLPFRFIESDN